MHVCLAFLVLLLMPTALAQSSTSYKISDHVFNQGGHPDDGTVLASASYRVTLDSIGEGIIGRGMTSASYRMDGSFSSCYPPPGEVIGLRFDDHDTLTWSPEKSVGVYNLYRGDALPDPSWPGGSPTYGEGFDCDIDPMTSGETATDPATPGTGAGFYYLVSAENRLGEEGILGDKVPDPYPSGSGREPATPCP